MGSKPLAPFMDALLMANPLSSLLGLRAASSPAFSRHLPVGSVGTKPSEGFQERPPRPAHQNSSVPAGSWAHTRLPGSLRQPTGCPSRATMFADRRAPPWSGGIAIPALWKPLWVRTHDAVGEAAILLRPHLLAPQWQVTLLVSLPPDRCVPLPSRTSGHPASCSPTACPGPRLGPAPHTGRGPSLDPCLL